MIAIDRPNFYTVLAGIVHQLGGAVKPHGLAVEQCRGKNVWIVALDPGGNIHQQRETRRMAFGESVTPKSFQLFEYALGKFFFVTIVDHAFNEHFFILGDFSLGFEGGHAPAKAIGLGGRKPRCNDGYFHGLFLEKGNAQGAAQDSFQFLGGIFDGFFSIASSEIRMDHIALYGSGTHKGHFYDEIIKIPGLHAGEHGHLGPAFYLKHA